MEHAGGWRVSAAAQLGLVSRNDLRAAGVDRAAYRRILRHGELVVIGRQTLRSPAAPATSQQRVLAACLETGGVASHRTAAWLHGLDGFGPGRPPEVVVRRPGHDYRLPLASVHTTTRLPDDDLVVVGSVPTLGVARTLLTLAALVPDELSIGTVRGAVDEAVRDGKASDRWLWWRLERLRCRGRTGVSAFEEILTLRSGGKVTESWLERETLRLIAVADLPLPVCQARIAHRGAFAARVDFLYEPNAIIEVSGHRYHHTAEQQTADAARRRVLVEAGHDVYEFSYDEIVRHPERLLATVRHILGLPAAAAASA